MENWMKTEPSILAGLISLNFEKLQNIWDDHSSTTNYLKVSNFINLKNNKIKKTKQS